MIDPRKLAAIDIAFLGSKFVVSEFAVAVLLCVALGSFILLRAVSFSQFALGLYFISLGFNYVPMLFYAAAITKAGSARAEIASELDDQRRAMAKYRRQSIYLLLPLVVPVVALRNHRRNSRVARPGV